MYPIASFLRDYGEVSLPDLPGIGGMDSFYRIGLTPTLDTYADYLYTVLKTRGLRKQVDIVAMSFGFLVVTRMLQRHPDSQEWIDNVISFVGFGRSTDFKNIEKKRRTYVPISRIFSTKLGSWMVSTLIFNPLTLRLMFSLFRLFNPKYQHAMKNDRAASERMELDLWQKNDARTRFAIYQLFFTFDLTRHETKLPVRLHDMTTKTDQYLDHRRINESLKLLYANVSSSHANMALHAPSIIGTESEVRAMFSKEVKSILS